jgi:glucuronosyltransferase
VLWTYEFHVPQLPKNVQISNWLPQRHILTHPNVRLFIQHGGFLSLAEAVYFGVSIIGIPVFADQKSNTQGAVKCGYAIKLFLDEISDEKLSWVLNEMLSHDK